MTLSDPKSWLARKPLAEANQEMWVRGIQAEAIRWAARQMPTTRGGVTNSVDYILSKANELEPPTKKET